MILRFSMRSMAMTAVALCAALLLLIAQPVHAEEMTNTDAVMAAETTDDAMQNTADSNEQEFVESMGGIYVRAANIVQMTDNTDQDAFIAGNSLTLDGTVNDLFAAGSDVTINGTVNGSVRAAGSSITINGTVNGNIVVFGSTVRLSKTAVVHGHVNVYGATVLMDGSVDKTFEARAQSVIVNGHVGGEVYVEGEQVTFGQEANIDSTIAVEGPNAPTVNNESLAASVHYTEKQLEKKKETTPMQELRAMVAREAYWFFALALIGIVVLAVQREKSGKIIEAINAAPGAAAVHGVLFILLLPILAILLMVTIVGIPLGLLLVAVYVAVLAISSVFVGLWIGNKLLPSQSKEGFQGVVIQFLVGFLLLSIVSATPFVGWLVSAAATLFGAGATVYVALGKQK